MNTLGPEVLYTPRSRSSLAFGEWGEMVRELWRSRDLITQLFLRDFAARYRETLLGYVWAVVPPVVTMVTFSWLTASSLVSIRKTSLPYPVYLLVTTTVWQLFAGGLMGATQSLVTAGSFITKINFPRKALVIASFGQAVVDSLVRSCLVVAGFAIWGVRPGWSLLLVPLLIVPLALFTLGLGLVSSLLNGLARDVGQLLAFLLTFWMFLTPVVYPLPADPLSVVHLANPMTYFVVAATEFTEGRALSHPGGYLASSAAGLVIFLVGWRLFHLAETRIAERV